MFTIPCRGEAFACLGVDVFMPITANASPLLFQKTKLLPKRHVFTQYYFMAGQPSLVDIINGKRGRMPLFI
ncbi:MAG: hypothetical protein HCAMLNBO_01266 [Candidatus Brocadia fulgida]|nr:hypothetical protein [Candidatus Brocadia fulgida]